MLNSWSVCNRIIPKDQKELVKGVKEPDPQLQQCLQLREEAKFIEQWSKAISRGISQDQILGQRDYATIERQAVYDDHTLHLCCTVALNSWDRIGSFQRKETSQR